MSVQKCEECEWRNADPKCCWKGQTLCDPCYSQYDAERLGIEDGEGEDESHDDYDDQGILYHYSKTTGGWDPIENDESDDEDDLKYSNSEDEDDKTNEKLMTQIGINNKRIEELKEQNDRKDAEIARLTGLLTRGRKSCNHIWVCGCDKVICNECIVNPDEPFCENESCCRYYENRNDNCSCNDCEFCINK